MNTALGTREKNQVREIERLDVDLLKPFEENPYTQPLKSVA